MQWKVEREMEGEEVYIVGGGPSIKNLRKEVLKGKRIIVANNSYRLFPDAYFLFFMDYHEWYVHHKKELSESFKGRLVSTNHKTKELPEVLHLESNGNKGLSRNPGSITNGNNSGMGAVNLAFLLGAKTIVLIGFDMRLVNNEHNFHKDHFRPSPVPIDIYETSFLPNFSTMAEELKKEEVEVWNATPESALKAFSFRHDLIEALYNVSE